MNEATVKKLVGLAPSPTRLNVYSHLANDDAKKAYVRLQGLKVADTTYLEKIAVDEDALRPAVPIGRPSMSVLPQVDASIGFTWGTLSIPGRDPVRILVPLSDLEKKGGE